MKRKPSLEQILNRVKTAHQMGLLEPEIIKLAYEWCDAIMRLEGGQFQYFAQFMKDEFERTERFSSRKTLANDETGYNVIRLLSILLHPCQICAEDTTAWHTRAGFCPHRELLSKEKQVKNRLKTGEKVTCSAEKNY